MLDFLGSPGLVDSYFSFELLDVPVTPVVGVLALVASVVRSENITEWPLSVFEDIEEVADAMLTVALLRSGA
jgi:hypothetical protein